MKLLTWLWASSFILSSQQSKTLPTTYSWQPGTNNSTNSSRINGGSSHASTGYTFDAYTTEASNVSVFTFESNSLNNIQNTKNNNTTQSYGGPDMSKINSGFITKQQYNYATNAISFAVLPCLLLAVAFNIANISVFGKKQMKAPSRQYLMILSICELLFTLFSSVLAIMAVIYKEKSSSTYIYLWYTNFISPTVIVSLRRSAFVLNFWITLERFIVVSFPLKFRNFKLTRYPVPLSLFMMLSCLALHIPPALKFSLHAVNRPGSLETMYALTETQFFHSNQQHIHALITAINIIFVYIPLASSFLLNVFVIIALKMHQKAQLKINTNQSTEKSRQAKQMTVTLAASSFVFVLFSLPLNLNTILVLFVENYGFFKRQHYVFLLMFRVGFLCEVIGNCTDFIFYFLLSSKFRMVFVMIYCLGASDDRKKGLPSFNSMKDRGSMATISSQTSM